MSKQEQAWQNFKAWVAAVNATGEMPAQHHALSVFLNKLVGEQQLNQWRANSTFTAICYADHCTAELVAERDVLKAELAALKAAQEWRGMESAPKDGARILVFIDNGDDPIKTVGERHANKRYWISSWSGEVLYPPTHWMPLPTPPHRSKAMIKTAELSGKALDWALADALELEPRIDYFDVQRRPSVTVEYKMTPCSLPYSEVFSHTDPALCLGLIKEYRASIDQAEHYPLVEVHIWFALDNSDDPDYDSVSALGDTPEQAVARCVVAMRLGDEVDVLDELVKPERSRPSSDDYKYCHNHD